VLVFARTSGQDGKAQGISAFLVPVDAPGLEVPYYHWSFNMPTDHGEVTLTGVHVGDDAVVGELDRGLDCAQLFVHENRIRQAASSLGAAQFCIDRSIAYTRERVIFGKPLADYQGDAADRAIQVHGGLGYMRALPFEFIYRHHRRYRITEGSDELQLRRIAGRLFGFTGGRAG
jgi:alkylation response protein AidB-like acyl-CoA dehydrogenase